MRELRSISFVATDSIIHGGAYFEGHSIPITQWRNAIHDPRVHHPHASTTHSRFHARSPGLRKAPWEASKIPVKKTILRDLTSCDNIRLLLRCRLVFAVLETTDNLVIDYKGYYSYTGLLDARIVTRSVLHSSLALSRDVNTPWCLDTGSQVQLIATARTTSERR